ncbi:MAG: hypothetical protein JXL67_13480 [Calditrichaeota bacterium]|nr:hypothetical protein [Calditrichota bacterium]
MTFLKEFFRLVFILLLSSSLLFLPVPSLINTIYAQSQGVCEKQLADAEQRYNTGRFDEAIGLITECLGKPGLTEQEKMKAYRLLGLSYIAKDYLEDARTAVKKLLDMVPNYQSDPVQDPPPFTKMVEEVKVEQQQPKQKPEVKQPKELEKMTKVEKKKGSNTKWYLIGGGVLAAGAVVAILASGGGNGETPIDNTLPGPPSLP